MCDNYGVGGDDIQAAWAMLLLREGLCGLSILPARGSRWVLCEVGELYRTEKGNYCRWTGTGKLGYRNVCMHNKQKTDCRICHFAAFCTHNKLRTQCKSCGGSALCKHGNVKRYCRGCSGSMFCKHGTRKAQCKICKGSGLCVHDRQKHACRICGRDRFCEHRRLKRSCKFCHGTHLARAYCSRNETK